MPEQPYCTIVVPAFNEEQYIEQCLIALKSQTYPKDNFEIIVIDNNSSDNTVEIARNYADHVKILPDGNVGAVRNYGFKNASGDIIIFIDSDCVTDKSWLERAIRMYSSAPDTVLGGIYACRENPNWIEKYWFLETGEDRVVENNLLGGCIIISRKNFEHVGGFREEMSSGEDSALTKDLRHLGIEVEITPRLKVRHLGNPTTIKTFLKRQSWHAESYFSNKKDNFQDPIFWLVVIYPLTFIVTLTLSLIKSYYLPLLLITQLPPIILSTKRIIRSGYKPKPNEIIKILALDNLYLLGRSKGILKSIARKKKRT
ncbi:glycosyltransferase [Marinobacter sp.]|uniref:glycosyltransferase n=1 Tax=Marinobacter sp. TaxID=50741 RepID=UPI001B4F2D7E|nr:glycosyltransferase [Marinobacter sp.]MBQ0831319.1 glycosyltransferase [Marinobacter sp.]